MSSIERRTTGGISSHTTRLGTNMDGTEQTQSNADSARQITLTGFLLARIDEDEDLARGATMAPWDGYADGKVLGCGQNRVAEVVPSWNLGHIARHDPARVLAECEAKRRIVDFCESLRPDGGTADEIEAHLALPYADHPDYRDEWAP